MTALPQKAVARGSSTVNQAGRDVINGNVFVGRFVRLRDVWLDPAPVFEEVEVNRFVGREWLVAEVDRFLSTRDRGYVVIQADAGLGKTAFAAWLARSRGWPCHFTRRRKGRTLVTALRNLAVQLIAQYSLGEQFAPGGMLPETAGEPGWFEGVLREAASAADEKLVLVVDGLDEAENVEGDLPLGLPAVLPSGVFLVVTSRTGTDLVSLRQPYCQLDFAATDRRNIADLRQYLETASAEQHLAALLSSSGMAVDEFVSRLVKRCGGVWVYLRYVLDELRYDLRTLAELDQLPADLASYYLESLAIPQWTTTLPVLATLAAVTEPVPVEMLARLAGVTEADVRALCDGRLRPFLTVDENHRYAIYHASLREFLNGASSQHPFDRIRSRANELANATRAAHSRIADHYLSRLPEATVDGGYPRRYLAYHLDRAGRHDDLHALLAKETGDRNLWFEVQDQAGGLDDYLSDLRRARREAPFHLKIRYVVMTAAINTLTSGIPDELLARLVAEGLWTAERALNHARRLYTPWARADALVALLPHLSGDDVRVAVDGVLAASRDIVNPEWRCQALHGVIDYVPEEQREQVIADALASSALVGDSLDQAGILVGLVSDMPDSLMADALAVARSVSRPEDRAWALGAVSREMYEPQRGEILAEALANAYSTLDDSDRIWALAGLSSHLPTRQRARVLADAVTLARGLSDPGDRAWRLGWLVSMLDDPEDDPLFAEAHEAAMAITDDGDRGSALNQLAQYVSEPRRTSLTRTALSIVRLVADDEERVRCLTHVAPNLPDDERDSVLREVLAFAAKPDTHAAIRMELVQQVAEHLSGDLLTEAVRIGSAVTGDFVRIAILAALVPVLPGQLLATALSATRTVGDDEGRVRLLGELSGWLTGSRRDEAVREALAIARTGEPIWRARLLGELAGRSPEPAEVAREALDAGLTVDEEYRSLTLASLLRWSPASLRAEIVDGALAALARAQGHGEQIAAFERLLPYLADDQRDQAIKTIWNSLKAIPDPHVRVTFQTIMASHLPEPQRDHELTAALATARAFPTSGGPVAAALRKFARYGMFVPRKVLIDLLTTWRGALSVIIESSPPESLANMARHLRFLPKRFLMEALAASRALPLDLNPAPVLGAVALHLPEPLRERALTEVLTGARMTWVARRAILIQANLLGDHDPDLVLRCLDNLDLDECLNALAAAMPIVHAVGGMTAVESCWETVHQVQRWWRDQPAQRDGRG